MSAHLLHEELPGYDPKSILHDGCPECENRSRRGLEGVLALDRDRQLRLWGLRGPAPSSNCDARLSRELYTVRIFLEGAGISSEEFSQRFIELSECFGSRSTKDILDEVREDRL